ncbi:ATP-binding cassette domain-containing protein [Aeoliella sp. ICT_H6.2]|uniref:ATP-binding cassette domain-containing protein n=1 Tax=Aeoliella straminimaris TaxID=2954799 RepID=A0A9X2JFL4_9BACT|nr:ATP-binding cassette domain-containing protein [Aeoliella straminimaris]MCO6044155.1 ATP-binding cassette domain-containing protein [Aeoliella straminimaris]
MIECQSLSVVVADFRLAEVSLAIPTGEYGVLMGRTGSGKTTLLEAICGLRPLAGGTVRLAGRDVTALRPGDRHLGYVPQEAALFPRMTVRDNLGFALGVAGRPAAEIRSRTDQLAEQLHVTHLLPRRATGLSGGEQQRVALGRALAARPAVLLLDEPLAALDEQTRTQMIELLREVHAASETTTLHVTHNMSEAEALADVRLSIEDGNVIQSEPRSSPRRIKPR